MQSRYKIGLALKRYSRAVDGTIPIQALLYENEQLLSSQDTVGIYDGFQKSAAHQSGTIYSTSHRLFYIDNLKPELNSFYIDLSSVTQTEYYAGLFTSSAKVTLYLSGHPSADAFQVPSGDNLEQGTWECEVCGNKNPLSLNPTVSPVCVLCGVPRSAVPSSTTDNRRLPASSPSPGQPSTPNPRSSTPPDSVQDDTQRISCPACTFLNHPSIQYCEICGTDLSKPFSSRQKPVPVSPQRVPAASGDDDKVSMIKVSFRKGGDRVFYSLLKRTLKTKAWESYLIGTKSSSSRSTPGPDSTTAEPGVGISGILKTVESSNQGRQSDIKDALQDLEALMLKAQDMVHLAAELNEKLTAASSASTSSRSATPDPSGSLTASSSTFGNAEPEEATFIRSSLSQLGLQLDNVPITQDMVRDERKWFDELARELALVLQKPNSGIMRDRGIVALDEVWGGWNRARGVALIPPSTFLQVLPQLPQHTDPPISMRKFTSGLSVLHAPPYSRHVFSARLSGFLVANGAQTTMEVALHEGLAISLVREMIEAGEQDGDVCRDDAGEAAITGGASGTGVEVRWWPNIFLGYVWDGQPDPPPALPSGSVG